VQEQAQLRKAVDRIAGFEPDILLVEKSAARFAQDALLEKGVALVLNVKGSLLNRLARSTGAQASSPVHPECSQKQASPESVVEQHWLIPHTPLAS